VGLCRQARVRHLPHARMPRQQLAERTFCATASSRAASRSRFCRRAIPPATCSPPGGMILLALCLPSFYPYDALAFPTAADRALHTTPLVLRVAALLAVCARGARHC